MEEKVLYNVLKTIRAEKSINNSAPDDQYVPSLVNIGMVKNEWEGYFLTDLGYTILSALKVKFEKW